MIAHVLFDGTLKNLTRDCETFGTPGFFGVEFFYQPEDGKFYTKLCPAPVTPKVPDKGSGLEEKERTEMHFNKHTQSFHWGLAYLANTWVLVSSSIIL